MRKDERSEASNVNMLSAAAHVFADSMRTVSELVSSALAVWFGLDAVVTDAWASFLVNTSVLVAALALLYSLVRRFKSCEDGFEVIDDEGRARVRASTDAPCWLLSSPPARLIRTALSIAGTRRRRIRPTGSRDHPERQGIIATDLIVGDTTSCSHRPSTRLISVITHLSNGV